MKNIIISYISENLIPFYSGKVFEWIWWTIPVYLFVSFILFVHRTVSIFIFLYKNNRSGFSNGFSKHYADRFLEICVFKSTLGFSPRFNKAFSSNGLISSVNDIFKIDSILIEKDLICKDLNNNLSVNNKFNFKSMHIKFSNLLLAQIFYLVSKFIYIDNPGYFK